jgi:hypothetical protein
MSRHGKLRQFIFECPEHGVTRFRTKTGKCLKCDPVVPGRPPNSLNRQRARLGNLPTYDDYCAIHIWTAHSVAHGKCLTCFTTSGAVRKSAKPGPPVDNTNPRAVARRAGLPSYAGVCDTHGSTAFGVQSGKCLTCCNSLGFWRSVPPASVVLDSPRDQSRTVKADNPRAAARRAGVPFFAEECATHGLAAHSVAHGKCLTCFTSAGRVRDAGTADTARAAARRAGLTTFEGLCATHGKTPHSVRHGGCLTCLNAYGVPRRRPS